MSEAERAQLWAEAAVLDALAIGQYARQNLAEGHRLMCEADDLKKRALTA